MAVDMNAPSEPDQRARTPAGAGTEQSADPPGAAGSVAPGESVPGGPFGPRALAVWLMVTGLVGAAASFLLLHERVQLWQDPDHITACDVNPWVSCGEVMASWQASTFGFPNIFIGVVAFPVVIALAVTLLAGLRPPRWFWLGLQAGVVFAFGFCVWLWSQAVYAIGALCPYCMIVWAAVIPMTVAVTARNILAGDLPSSPRLRRLTADWWWVVMAVIVLLVVASIAIELPHALGL
ncbi:vitamin K epoxide reductase family protein [Nesterenkonia suensis]